MVGEEQAQSRMSKESLVDAEQQATLKVLGYLFLRMGRLDSARRTFTALAALLPEDAPAQERSWVERNLAAVALEEGDAHTALAHIDSAMQSITLTTGDAALHLLRARALWQQGRQTEAQQAIDTYIHMAGVRA